MTCILKIKKRVEKVLRVKSSTEIKKNYEDSTTIVTPRYKAGLVGATWKDPALAGQDLYEAKMTDPNVLARREKAIQRVSDEEWRKAANDKGAPIIAARMKGASQKQVTNFEPYRALLEGMTLPAKTADPATNVANRVTPIAVAFANKKNEIG